MSGLLAMRLILHGSLENIFWKTLAELCAGILNYRVHKHCMKCVQIQSYFWSVFSCIQSEYRKIRTRNNSAFKHFSRSESKLKLNYPRLFDQMLVKRNQRQKSPLSFCLLKQSIALKSKYVFLKFFKSYFLIENVLACCRRHTFWIRKQPSVPISQFWSIKKV